MGISEATFYRWKQLYGGLMPSEVKKFRHLEEENTRLRKVVADLTLDKEMRPFLDARGGLFNRNLKSVSQKAWPQLP